MRILLLPFQVAYEFVKLLVLFALSDEDLS